MLHVDYTRRKDMRINFASKVQGIKPDIRKEYDKLYNLYTEEFITDFQNRAFSFEWMFVEHFKDYPFETTCLTLDEFNEECGNCFEEEPENFDMDYFVNFAEYFYNMLIWFPTKYYGMYFFHLYDISFVEQHILKVIEAIGYMTSNEEGFTIFVPRDNVAISVSELNLIPENVSYKIIAYNHHSMKGNIDEKRDTLLILANLLEPYEKILNGIDASFKSDLFYALNNFNIRHNNVEPLDAKNYKKVIADMPLDILEHWYDETYQMCLLAFMRLEQNERKKEFAEVKRKIETKE